MQGLSIFEIDGNNFPFGTLPDPSPTQKLYVKKRYHIRSVDEQYETMQKVEVLKTISHKNVINLRSIEAGEGYVELIYQYVTVSLEESFNQFPTQTVKEIHRQFIELAIFLAKNCITTAFNASQCGIVVKEGRSVLKYYLPLTAISLNDNREALERSVQVFNLQSMHYLDQIFSSRHPLAHSINSEDISHPSKSSFKNRVKLFPFDRQRKDSLSSLSRSKNSRNLNPKKEEQFRKLSTLSKQFSEISEMHKRHRNSTRAGGSFNTINSFVSLRSNPPLPSTHPRGMVSLGPSTDLKRCLSDYIHPSNVQVAVERSRKAMASLEELGQKIDCYKQLFLAIKGVQKEHEK